MSIIKSENWDGVVAPAIPSGWTVATQLATAATNAPTSSPNSLVYPLANVSGSAVPEATWATQDGAAGNVQLSATVRYANTTGAGEQDVWIFARATSSDVNANWSAVSLYEAGVSRGLGSDTFFLVKRVAGSNVTLAQVHAVFADATNYRIVLSLNGSLIKAKIQRLSDAAWLNSSGTWAADPSGATWACTSTDTAVSGQGYAGAGFFFANAGGGTVGVDDWLLETLGGPPTTYYVAAGGSDANAGTSAAAPWQTIAKVNATALNPGDQVLFHAGDVFTGNLVIQSSGTAALPLAVGSYGSGQATISPGAGTGILLQDCDYVSVSNLAIVGPGVTVSGATSSTTSTGYGVEVLTTTTQASVASWRTGITLAGLGVQGCYYGIVSRAGGGSSAGPYPVGHNALAITRCTVHDCLVCGIMTTAGTAPIAADYSAPGDTPYHKNTYIGDCIMYNIYGDSRVSTMWSGSGLLLSNTDRGLIERCLAYNCGQANGNASGGPVGMWFNESTNCVIQYCEVHHQHDPGGADGGAFDFDGGSQGCIVQYSYSHDNDGPAIQAGTYTGAHATTTNTFRYNVTQNDGRIAAGTRAIGYREFSTASGIVLHNNVFYCAAVPAGGAVALVAYSNAAFYNNIFWVGSGAELLSAVNGGTFAGNLYWFGGASFSAIYNGVTYTSLGAFQAVQETVGGAPTGLNADPELVAPGTAGTLLPSAPVSTLGAYMPRPSSPLIDAGLDLRALFALDPGALDFCGHPIRCGARYDIGACEYGAAALAAGGGVRRVSLAGGIGG